MNKKENKLMEKNKGLWIPMDVLKAENLTLTEKIVYAYYLQLTKNAEKHQAIATNEQIAEILSISPFTLKDKIKPALRKKGLISTKGICTKTISNPRQKDAKETEIERKKDDTTPVKNTMGDSKKDDTAPRQKDYTKQEYKQEIKQKESINKTTVVTEEKKLDFGKSCFEGKKTTEKKTTQIPSEEETMDWMLDGEKLTEEKTNNLQADKRKKTTDIPRVDEIEWKHPDGGDVDEWVESVRYYRLSLKRNGETTPRKYNPANPQHVKEKEIILSAPLGETTKKWLKLQLFSTDTTAE